MERLLFWLTLIMLVGGCGKDNVAPAPAPTKKPACYLLKSITTNSVNDAVLESIYTLNSAYKATASTTTIAGSSGSSTTIETYSYGVNGKIEKTQGTNYRVEYNYNGSEQLISVSYYVNAIVASSATMQYNSFGQLILQSSASVISGVLTDLGSSAYTYADNTTKNANTETFRNTSNQLQFTIEYEYDTSPKPNSSIGYEAPDLEVPSINNVTKTTYIQVAGAASTTVTEFIYQYNKTGYPTQRISTSSFVQTDNYTYDCKE